MAHTDKSSRFGTSTSALTSPIPGNVHWSSADSGTPADESAVADLVMEMLPKSDLGIEKDFHSVPLSCGSEFPAAAGSFSVASDRTEMPVTEEEVCAAMLQSLNEADLKMIETQLGVSSDSDAHRSTILAPDASVEDKMLPPVGGIVALSPYLPESLLSLSQTSINSTTNGLLDVDEINDSDLLSADLVNMNVLLNDLSTPTRDVRVNSEPATTRSNLVALFDMPQICVTEHDASHTEPANVVKSKSSPVTSPPELTTVNMFWNDLPGLLIDGIEYIRLVDIHRQMLPAKDTGILKKRCQMLGLDVRQCTELQRDFLIRYMNAAKSKSTVIISRPYAMELIGFYVNPKTKTLRSDDSESDSTAASTVTADDKVNPPQLSRAAARRGVAENTATLPYNTGGASLPPSTDHGENASSLPSVSASPAELQPNVKRSERLRDKHVRYADMVLGFHHRHGAEADSENDNNSAACFRPKRAAELEWPSSRVKHRRTSGDMKIEHEYKTKTDGMRTSSDDPRPACVVQHPHRPDVASSCEETFALQVEITGTHQKAAICSRQHCEPHAVPVDGTLDKLITLMSGSDSGMVIHTSITEGITHENRGSVLQRANRMRARRRSRIASQSKRLKRQNVTIAKCSTISRTCDNTSMLTSTCEDYKENMNVEGYVADNMYDNTIRRDSVEAAVSNTDILGAADSASGSSAENKALTFPVTNTADDVNCKADIEARLEPEPSAVELLPVVVLSTAVCTKVATKEDMSRPVGNIVQVRHCDVRSRFGRRRRSQGGSIMLDRFTESDAACVCCDTCHELFSVASFVEHMHVGSDVDKLATVNILQRLEPRGTRGQEWQVFQRLWSSFIDSKHLNFENANCESSPLSDNHYVEFSLPGDMSPLTTTDEQLPALSVPEATENCWQIQSNASNDSALSMAEKSSCSVDNPSRRVTRSVDTATNEKGIVHREPTALRHRNSAVSEMRIDDRVRESLTRRTTRSCDIDVPVKLKVSRSGSSVEACSKTTASIARHNDRAVHRRHCPLADLKQETVLHETRGHSRPNYRLRSPSGAMASKC